MNIQFNSDKILNVKEAFAIELKGKISEKLKLFSNDITGLDIHVTDENGIKDGVNDIRCLAEAHLKGMQSIVAIEKANTLEQSVNGAIDKLKSSLFSILRRSSDREHHSTAK